MARDHARVNVTIWGDPKFRRLPPPAQHLYLALWTSPELSYCGVHDWRPARLTGLAEGWTREAVEQAAACLAARHFLVIDHDTEEVMIRSWIRWDGLMKQPRMAISCINAYSAVASPTIREVVVHQLNELREKEPDYSAWGDERVQEVLSHPSADPKTLPTPSDPFGGGVTPGFTPDVTPPLTHGLGQTQGKGKGSVSVPPTPAPAPAPNSITPAPPRSRRKPEQPLPEDWSPNDTHREQARAAGIDLERETEAFRSHAQANDRRLRDWDAGFRMWLTKARPTNVRPLPRRDPDAWMQRT